LGEEPSGLGRLAQTGVLHAQKKKGVGHGSGPRLLTRETGKGVAKTRQKDVFQKNWGAHSEKSWDGTKESEFSPGAEGRKNKKDPI